MQREVFDKINEVLIDWNPIGVDDEVVDDEYKKYIPIILKNIDDKISLKTCLEEILINDLDIGYDPKNQNHSMDLDQICDKLMEVYGLSKS